MEEKEKDGRTVKPGTLPASEKSALLELRGSAEVTITLYPGSSGTSPTPELPTFTKS